MTENINVKSVETFTQKERENDAHVNTKGIKRKYTGGSKNSLFSNNNNEKNKHKDKDKILYPEEFIAENFVLLNLAGKGAFGEIYLSYSVRDGIEVAVKKEKKRPHKNSQLKIEGKIYQSLLNINPKQILTGAQSISQDTVQGVAKFYGYGEVGETNYLIMEFLGPNLNELFTFCKTNKLTITCVSLIAIQILNRLENLHKHYLIHRDVKPENFAIGTEEKTNVIYLIDFGLSKPYKNSRNNQHIPYREGRPLTGTARYVSINTHLGIEQSRRDDLESVGYLLVFFLKGTLPWKGLKGIGNKYEKIMEKKLQIPTEILCYGLPDEMVSYLNYCKNLRFEDKPDYDFLRGLFIRLLSQCSVSFGISKEFLKFDWCFDDPQNTIWKMFYIKDMENASKVKDSGIFSNKNNYSHALSSIDHFDSKNNIKLDKIEEDFNEKIKNENNNNLNNKNSKNSKISKNSNNEEKTNENNISFSLGSSFSSEMELRENLNKKEYKNTNHEIKILSAPNISNHLNKNNININNNKGTLEVISSKKSESSEETIKIEFKGKADFAKLKEHIPHNHLPLHISEEDIDLRIAKILSREDRKVNERQSTRTQDYKHSNESDSNDKIEKLKLSPVIGSRKKENKIKDSIEINKSTIVLHPMNEPEICLNENPITKIKSIANCDNDKNNKFSKNSNSVLSIFRLPSYSNNQNDKRESNESSGSSGIAERSPTLLKNTMKNSKVTLTEKESQQLKSIGKVKSKNINFTSKKDINIDNINSKSNVINNNKSSSSKVLKREEKKNLNDQILNQSLEKQNHPKIQSPQFQGKKISKFIDFIPLKENEENFKISKENTIKIKKEPISKYYKIFEELGHGSYGMVKKVNNIKLKELRAMKIVSKQSESSQNEVDILRRISHPNIVNIFEIFEDSKNYYIMFELLEGGELFEAISLRGSFCEREASIVMKQILKAVNYLHALNIVHRDLKPENIMLTSKTKFDLKLIDFGTARARKNRQKLSKFIGTCYYIAPEVLKENYDEKCDIWSCGVILYILISGSPPFNGTYHRDIYYNIQNEQPKFDGEEWNDVSKEVIDLIEKMLNKQPSKRLSAEECLNHEWFKLFELNGGQNISFKNFSSMKQVNDKHLKAISKMSKFVKENKLKQAVLHFITTHFNLKKEEEKLKEIFREFDTKKKGLITKDIFLKQLISLYGENDANIIVNKIFKTLDLDGSGMISYNEFLTSLIDDKRVLTNERLECAFKMFDKDNNGRLSINEIKKAFGGEEKAWKKVISEIDKNNDGEVDFEEFKEMMLGLDQNILFDK